MVGGWVKNGRFWRYVIMQWPLTSLLLLDYCNSILIHTSSIYPSPPQCCMTHQKLEAKGSYHPSSSATLHQSTNFIQNLCPHVQHPFRVISATCHPWSCTKVESRSSLRMSAKGDYITQHTTGSFGQRVFAVTGPSEWNKLSVSLRHVPSIGSLKTKLKTHLFQTDNI